MVSLKIRLLEAASKPSLRIITATRIIVKLPELEFIDDPRR